MLKVKETDFQLETRSGKCRVTAGRNYLRGHRKGTEGERDVLCLGVCDGLGV